MLLQTAAAEHARESHVSRDELAAERKRCASAERLARAASAAVLPLSRDPAPPEGKRVCPNCAAADRPPGPDAAPRRVQAIAEGRAGEVASARRAVLAEQRSRSPPPPLSY